MYGLAMILKFLKGFERKMRAAAFSRQNDLEITKLLNSLPASTREQRDELAEALYPELKRIARAKMAGEPADHTLQPTALVSELYLTMMERRKVGWADRDQFLFAATRAMHNLLIDHARQRHAQKRGGGWIRLELDDVTGRAGASVDYPLLHIDEVLETLARKEPRMAKIVEMKCFGGFKCHEIAKALDVTERTVKRDWALAELWLRGQLGPGGPNAGELGED